MPFCIGLADRKPEMTTVYAVKVAWCTHRRSRDVHSGKCTS